MDKSFCQKILEKSGPHGIATYMRYNPDFSRWVEQQAPASQKPLHSIYIILNGIPPRCKYGNDLRFKNLKEGYCDHCIDITCPCKKENRLRKYKKTMMERYGVENGFESDRIKQKSRETMLEKYGVEFGSQSDTARQKQRKNWQDRTLEERKQIKNKSRDSMIRHFGCDHHMKLDEQQEN